MELKLEFMNKKSFFLLIAAFYLLGSSLAWADDAAADKIPEPVKLQLKWFHQFQFAGYYAAKELGFFAEEGLDVEIRERDPNQDYLQQVVSGQADYGIGDSGLIADYANGAPIVALAAIFQHDALVLFSKQSSGIISPYELAGKRVMYDIAGENNAPIRAMLAEANLTGGLYSGVAESFNSDDLIQDNVDAFAGYLTDRPFEFQEKGVKFNIINPQNYGIDFYGDLLFTSRAELTRHPGRAERFRRASLKGWQYALDHPEETIAIIRDNYHSKLSLDQLRFEAVETRKLILPGSITLGEIEAGRLRLDYKAVDVAEVVDDAIKSTKRQIEDKKQTIAVAMGDSLPKVWADRTRVGQVLINLVSNAQKYTQEGGNIVVHAEKSTNNWDTQGPAQVVHIWVEDNGIGISPEDQKKIFQRFFRSEDDQARKSPGTGLGLNITRSLVEMQGGRIWFESEFRKGTIFHFTVPISEN